MKTISGLFIKGQSVWDVYQKIWQLVSMKKFHVFETPLFIQVENIISDLPNIPECEIAEYYSDFQSEKLDKRWDVNQKWYLSYARRLIEKRNDISQLYSCLDCLVSDKNSHRCVLSTYDLTIDNKNYRPALSHITFWISSNTLFMNAHWRSQEIFYAFPVNCIAMLSFMRTFYNALQNYYPDLKLGIYSQFTDMSFIHEKLNYQYSEWDFTKYLYRLKEDELKFLWGIIDQKNEGEFDEHYKQKT